jgi:hypothetical protein
MAENTPDKSVGTIWSIIMPKDECCKKGSQGFENQKK